jgi:N utilization substance protein B
MFVIYQGDLTGTPVEEHLAVAAREARPDRLSDYVGEIVRGVDARRSAIDAEIERNVSGWPLERLGYMERSILRVAVWEIQESTVPAAVAVNEAVELAKRFCAAEAAAFVNGVLGAVTRAAGADR